MDRMAEGLPLTNEWLAQVGERRAKEYDDAVVRQNKLSEELREITRQRVKREMMQDHIRSWIRYLRGFARRACHDSAFKGEGHWQLYSGITQVAMYSRDYDIDAPSLLHADLSPCASGVMQWMLNSPVDTLNSDRLLSEIGRIKSPSQSGPSGVPDDVDDRPNIDLPTLDEILDKLKKK